MAEIYELNPLQYAVLRKAALEGNRTFAVLEPSETLDEPVRRARLADELRQMEDLVAIGLTEDISADFTESIAVCKRSNKRGYKVHALTDAGFLMFNECIDPACTEHKKRLPC